MRIKFVIMNYLYLCICSIFFVNFISSGHSADNIQFVVHPVADIGPHKFFEYRGTLELTCNVTSSPFTTSYTVKWYKDGEDVNNIEMLKSRIKFDSSTDEGAKFILHTLRVNRPVDEDNGNYTCSIIWDNGRVVENDTIVATGKGHVKVPSNVNVVEAERLRLHCQAIGRPHLIWEIGNQTFDLVKKNPRVKLMKDEENDLPNAILLIENVEMSDRNMYKCIATNRYTGFIEDTAECYVRVKDKLAALWPFLGICAEVVILCAIILIYEKKRNKQELEESDTDQSPDQKHTPDHGKDSDVRHRK